MARRGATLAAAAALLLAACSNGDAAGDSAPDPAGDWPEGLYGNVDLSELSGDLGGLEVRFYREGDRRMAEFVLCEGWCNKAHTAEVVARQGGFAFVEAAPGDRTVEYLLSPSGDNLSVRLFQDGRELDMGGEPWLISPLEEPLGLAIAKGED